MMDPIDQRAGQFTDRVLLPFKRQMTQALYDDLWQALFAYIRVLLLEQA